jgi:hypothetical protein
MIKREAEHLMWIYNRLAHLHCENENVDYMLEFKSIIGKELNKENDSIAFANYLHVNQWVKREHTHPNKVGQWWSNEICEYKTIEEIYQEYDLEKNGKAITK